MRAGQARQVREQKNKYFEDLVIKSGEPILRKNGKARIKTVLMPKKVKTKRGEEYVSWGIIKWRDRMIKTSEILVDGGYKSLNNVDWGNIK